MLRSLPNRFVYKVTAFEESKYLNILTKNDLLGSPQTFEANVLNKNSSKNLNKEKSIAFRANHEQVHK